MKKLQRSKVTPRITQVNTPDKKEDEPKTKPSASNFGGNIVDLTDEYEGQGFQIIGGVRPPKRPRPS
jgi:hypothetical protein